MAKVLKNNSINLVDLDQQGLVNSFKNYLRTQDEWKDYDFDGSSMSVLLDILAMNTFKNAFYLNMSFSERWIDSAQLRSSLCSHAKELNYIPRSKRSAVAKIRVSFTATGETQPYVIQKGSSFSTLVKSKSYSFTMPETISIASVDNNFSFEADIYEGIYIKDTYIFKDTSFLQRFVLKNKNVDTESLTVTVFEDGKTVGDVYKQATTLLGLNQNSKVFFLQVNETANYEIYFGDNVLGRQPKNNAVILLDYRVSTGAEANGARVFNVDFDPTGAFELVSTPTVEVIEAAHNGEEEESNESIRYYAPRHFQVQERAVVSSDYEILLRDEFPEISSVAVFGGEELNPPRFSRVYISVKIRDVDGLPESKKDAYSSFLKTKSMFSIVPIFIEPEIIYLEVASKVRYNINVTTNTDNRIKALVESAVLSYNIDTLNDFNVTIRNATLIDVINTADDSIISNITEVRAYKKVTPVFGVDTDLIISFGFGIVNNLPAESDTYDVSSRKAVTSSLFLFKNDKVIIEDDGEGVLRMVKPEGDVKRRIVDVGTVDYEKGIINIPSLKIDSYLGDGVRFYVRPADLDITCKNNNIMTIQASDIIIEPENLRL